MSVDRRVLIFVGITAVIGLVGGAIHDNDVLASMGALVATVAVLWILRTRNGKRAGGQR